MTRTTLRFAWRGRNFVPAPGRRIACPTKLLIPLTLFFAVAAGGQSTTSDVVTEQGVHQAVFQIPKKGTIRVNFPDDLAAGDAISGTVYPNPSGKDQKERDRNGAELSGYVIEIEDQKSRAADDRFRWRVPERVAAGLVTLVLRDRKNKALAQCRLPVDPRRQPAPFTEWVLPLGGQTDSLISAWGPVGTDTSVALNGTSATIIAESPRKLVFQVPSEIAGRAKLEIRSGGRVAATGTFYGLGVRLTATQTKMIRGQTAVLTVTVSGLFDLKEPASLRLTNSTPGIVAIEGGTVQDFVIEPPRVGPNGTFLVVRGLTSLQAGGFNISALVTRAPSSQVPLDRLAARAVDSWSRGTGIAMSPEARSLITSDVIAARSQLDAFLQAQLAFRADAGSIMDSMVREYCFELRDRKLRTLALGRWLPQRLPLVNAFVPQPAAAVSIDAPDVRSHSFLQYLGQLLAKLTPSRPVGDLLVMSQPDKQMITIDRTSGLNYYTTRTFVVSVGDHTVAVASCKEIVKVGAYQKVTMNCPRR